MILVTDVETSGLVVKDLPLDNLAQPRIVQLGFVVHDSDRHAVHKYTTLLRPGEDTGWSISREAESVHGITTEDCAKYGVHPRIALVNLMSMMDCCRILVGHNIGFELGLLKREIDLLPEPLKGQLTLRLERSRLRRICTMRTSAALTADGKWPNLGRIYKILTGKDLVGAHDALADAEATTEVFWGLVDRRIIEL